MMASTQIPIPSDSDGFVTRQCKSCKSRLKLKSEQSNDNICCPYCGHASNDWLTDEQREYLNAHAKRFATKIADDRLKQMFGGVARQSNGVIKFKAEHRAESLPSPPLELKGGFDKSISPCCSIEIKTELGRVIKFCSAGCK